MRVLQAFALLLAVSMAAPSVAKADDWGVSFGVGTYPRYYSYPYSGPYYRPYYYRPYRHYRHHYPRYYGYGYRYPYYSRYYYRPGFSVNFGGGW